MTEPRQTNAYDAVMFDLLTGLLDSWSLWNSVAANAGDGFRWRRRYLALTYEAGAYRPYEEIVKEAARGADVPIDAANALIERWDELTAWPEVPDVLRALAVPMAIATNCSEALAQRAVSRVGVAFDVVISAERARAYKPRPEPYRLALQELSLPPERVLFVAGSAYDVDGAAEVGMDVYWHNRAGLPRTASKHQPLIETASLWSLIDFVRNGWGRSAWNCADCTI
jgi:2-haloacid dehalogenase